MTFLECLTPSISICHASGPFLLIAVMVYFVTTNMRFIGMTYVQIADNFLDIVLESIGTIQLLSYHCAIRACIPLFASGISVPI